MSRKKVYRPMRRSVVLELANPIIDLTLKVVGLSEQVQVEANVALVEPQNTGAGAVID